MMRYVRSIVVDTTLCETTVEVLVIMVVGVIIV
jgi:hypothetical protein